MKKVFEDDKLTDEFMEYASASKEDRKNYILMNYSDGTRELIYQPSQKKDDETDILKKNVTRGKYEND